MNWFLACIILSCINIFSSYSFYGSYLDIKNGGYSGLGFKQIAFYTFPILSILNMTFLLKCDNIYLGIIIVISIYIFLIFFGKSKLQKKLYIFL